MQTLRPSACSIPRLLLALLQEGKALSECKGLPVVPVVKRRRRRRLMARARHKAPAFFAKISS